MADMEAVCHHRHAGDFVISGWRPDDRPLTFPIENGSHGGPGSQETRGFLIIPENLHSSDKSFYRASDLRRAVLKVLGRLDLEKKKTAVAQRSNVLRVMTYNVHSCIGVDGKHLPERIARIIRRQNPDIVALQEIDRHQIRSARQDHTSLLGDWLEMEHFFWSVHGCNGGEYGLAVLSRYPIDRTECYYLPCLSDKRSAEKRGLTQIVLQTPYGKIHFFNTHLSLYRKERLAQMNQIIKEGGLAAVPPDEPTVFCGDLNAGVNSPVYKLLSSRLQDVEQIRPHMSPEPTFYSSWPLLRLDHIFHSRHFTPVQVDVANDWECRLASDHLPVLATLALQS
jgi:endonuclease/exonuclease/phosphatase family metal-dependent hydrolase